ncbi:DUF4013 domain-containing protein [Methanocalculus sp.]|uniref:DUF4013 domain-containing protein n=1 Tax=Methanocalculus sp. TaxID=2004547 RepID=UPI00271F7C81|nr:DUF4013 domain-containing protein [Methanocalculus sp.]MDO8840860.1 DUF4013 domain-containing protein [Methanocalculus sp.]
MIDIGAYAEESVRFTVAAIRTHPLRIPVLMAMVIIFPLIMGYAARIYRGGSDAPDFSHPRSLLIDGIRLILVSFIYTIPIFAAIMIIIWQSEPLLTLISHAERGLIFSEVGAVFFLILGVVLLYAIIILLSMIGVIRTARSGRIRDGFALGEILSHIDRIGGTGYVSAVIFYTVISLLASVPAGYLMELSLIGYIPAFFIYMVVTLFAARYFTLVFEAGIPRQKQV